jgi:succinyl-diaminopimelate desuccinylase
MDEVRDRLVGWLRLLVDAGAVTGTERRLADDLETVLGLDYDVERVGDSLIVGSPTGTRPVIALVGHIDVVPPTEIDLPMRIESVEGTDIAYGRGTSDMHAGNAVALELFTQQAALGDAAPADIVLVLYAREEGPADANELAEVLTQVSWLRDIDLAIILEPTDGQLQAGCLGGVHATVTFHGQQAHSARPWHGRNALTAAGPFLAALDALQPKVVMIDGIEYRDVWSATMASTTSARNVIPGEFSVNLNLRFAPSRDADTAVSELRQQVAAWTASLDGSGATVTVEVVDIAPPAPPRMDATLLQQLVEVTGAEVAGKQAWTDIARFAALGVPAVNYGPGMTTQAHQRGEHVAVDAVVDVFDRLSLFLGEA